MNFHRILLMSICMLVLPLKAMQNNPQPSPTPAESIGSALGSACGSLVSGLANLTQKALWNHHDTVINNFRRCTSMGLLGFAAYNAYLAGYYRNHVYHYQRQCRQCGNRHTCHDPLAARKFALLAVASGIGGLIVHPRIFSYE